jgi:NAD(P)-dependent dehydrogenase (short-subunit alcohol dehydrogenase family)
MTFGPTDVLLTDRVALVTGAASGIGAATALALAAFGADVALCDRDEAGLEAVATEVRSGGRRALTMMMDVRSDDDVAVFVERAASKLGGAVHIVVNNAGGTFVAPFEDLSYRGEQAVVAENFLSAAHVIRACLPVMPDGGSIITMTSIEAHRAAPGVAVYAAMKAGMASLTKSLALELAPRAIRVNCIAPDMIHTAGSIAVGDVMQAVSEEAWHQQPLPYSGSVEDAAAAAVFLAGDMSRFVTGVTIHVDGGNLASGGWKLHRRGIYVV